MPDTTTITLRFSKPVIKILKRLAYVRSEQLDDNRYGMGNAADDLILFLAEKHSEIIDEFLGSESEQSQDADPDVKSSAPPRNGHTPRVDTWVKDPPLDKLIERRIASK